MNPESLFATQVLKNTREIKKRNNVVEKFIELKTLQARSQGKLGGLGDAEIILKYRYGGDFQSYRIPITSLPELSNFLAKGFDQEIKRLEQEIESWNF